MRLQATSQRARDKNRGILSSLGGRALCLRLKRRVISRNESELGYESNG